MRNASPLTHLVNSPLMYALLALYYVLAARMAGGEVKGYGPWFNFTAWSHLPACIGPRVVGQRGAAVQAHRQLHAHERAAVFEAVEETDVAYPRPSSPREEACHARA